MTRPRHADDPAKLYERIVGVPPSAEQADRLRRIGSALDIKDNDALWSILVAFESYSSLYGAIPQDIASARAAVHADAKRIGKEAMQKVESDLSAWSQRTYADIMQAVVNAGQASRMQRALWMSTSTFIALVGFCLATFVGWQLGRTSGRAETLSEAHAGLVWAETEEAKAAKLLSESGELGALLRCDRPGWKLQNSKAGESLCMPFPEKNGSQFGWMLPTSAVVSSVKR